ncbi:MAG: hypothetical protein GY853_02935 [PVC group bacterium]|nr:hypothetical protein [PVC group bacterium]
MDRKIFCFIAILCFFCKGAFAIPAEGESRPSLHKSIWGVQFNHIFSRDFNKVEAKASTTQYFIKASYGLTEKFFLDGKVGWGNVSFDREGQEKLNFPNNFAGGYGFRYLFYEDDSQGLKAIAGFQHISCHPFKDVVNNIDHRIIWDEWQGTLLLIKKWNRVGIYFGPQYSEAQLKYKEGDLRRRVKGEDIWGAVIGADYYINEKTGINMEARLFNEWALNIGMNYKF